ncbi:MAG: hypothetical protein IPM36_03525 [Lewinellaceae bacterium]|nr:hypothetical protein [Lewinellaceae bacterium]
MFSIHLANYLVFCIAIKDFAGYKRYIGTLENIKADNSDLEAELFQNLRFIQILYYLNTNQLEIAQKLVPTVERGIKKYAFKINNSRLFALRVNIILVFFAAGEYKKALQHCAVLQQYGKSEQRRDVQLFTNILRHISHFELEEIDALESFVRKYKTNLSPASNFVPDFERIALTHLVQLADAYLKSTPGSEARRVKSAALFAEFQTALQKFRESNPPQIPLGTTETELWVKSKLAGKPFREMLME